MNSTKTLFCFALAALPFFVSAQTPSTGLSSSVDDVAAEDELYKMTSMYEKLYEAIELHRQLAGDYDTAMILLDGDKDPLHRLKLSIDAGIKKDEDAMAMAAKVNSALAESSDSPSESKEAVPIQPLEDIRATLVQWHADKRNIVAVLKIGEERNKHYSIGSTVIQNEGAPNQRTYLLKDVTRTESPLVKDRWSYRISLVDNQTRRVKFLDIK